jgi:hypothetical protein
LPFTPVIHPVAQPRLAENSVRLDAGMEIPAGWSSMRTESRLVQQVAEIFHGLFELLR